MSSNITSRREEVDRIFGQALPLIDVALASHYRLAGEAAIEVEQCLYEWFHGFARRPGSPQTPERLRPHLLLMTCEAAHVYWSGKLSGESARDEKLRRSLAIGPEQVASELAKTKENRMPAADPNEEGS